MLCEFPGRDKNAAAPENAATQAAIRLVINVRILASSFFVAVHSGAGARMTDMKSAIRRARETILFLGY